MLQPAIFLDRDGTVNYDSGYVKNPEEIWLLDGVAEGIRKLKDDFGFKMVIVSNQAGVAKGLLTIKDVLAVNDKINELLRDKKTSIDAFYFCPYHPDFDPPEKAICRKPSPFMIIKAAEELNLDLGRSYMVGDKSSDIEAGLNAGVKTVFITPDSAKEEISILHNLEKKPNFVAANFQEACDLIIKDFSGGNT